MASRDITDLHWKLQPLCQKFLNEASLAGINVLITCTYRSNTEQQALYDQGRKTPGRIVTNAKPGQSKHNCTDAKGRPASLAFDIVPLVNGKPQWDSSDPAWQTLGEIGKSLGLEWAGTWTHFKEYPHFQLNEA